MPALLSRLLPARASRPARHTPTAARRPHLGLEALEGREVPAVAVGGAWVNGTYEVRLTGDGAGDRVRIDNLYGDTRMYAATDLNTGWIIYAGYFAAGTPRFVFNGNGGNDLVRNNTAAPLAGHGGDGDDIVTGGSGNDTLWGGNGSDVVNGRGGNDTLANEGLGGIDDLYGGDGDDILWAGMPGTSTTYLYGQGGNDTLWNCQGVDERFTFDLSRAQGADRITWNGNAGGYDWIEVTNPGPGTLLDTGYLNAWQQVGPNLRLLIEGGNAVEWSRAANNPGNFADLQQLIGNGEFRGQIRSAYMGDRWIDRGEMIRLLEWVGNGGVTGQELADARNLTGTFFAMPESVRNLAWKTVHPYHGNQTYDGWFIGNLYAGAPEWHMDYLADKWFKGGSEPGADGGAVWMHRAEPLFGWNGPRPFDVEQGAVGDCWLMAGLASVARTNPQAIRDMFTDNGDGTYTVRFRANDGLWDYVTVNRNLPHTWHGGFYGDLAYAEVRAGGLWVALAEKAYAQMTEAGRLGQEDRAHYQAIEGGDPALAVQQITGRTGRTNHFRTGNRGAAIRDIDGMLADFRAGRDVVLGSNGNSDRYSDHNGVVMGHAYTLYAHDPATDRFVLYNPHGSLIVLTRAQILESFAQLSSVYAPAAGNRNAALPPAGDLDLALPPGGIVVDRDAPAPVAPPADPRPARPADRPVPGFAPPAGDEAGEVDWFADRFAPIAC